MTLFFDQNKVQNNVQLCWDEHQLNCDTKRKKYTEKRKIVE